MEQATMPTSSPAAEDDHASVRFVVTGFGPFGGVPENPTTILIERVLEYLRSHNSPLASMTETVLLETSAEGSRTEIDRIKERIETTSKGETKEIKVLLLHLGVNYKGKSFQLESCAYNDASFRIPDERGYQPEGISIMGDNFEVGTSLDTLLDVSTLVDEMNDAIAVNEGICGAPAVISTDPGRFVCNYTYLYSLHTFQCSKDVPFEEAPRKNNVDYRCVFLHVPPFEIVMEEQQLWFVTQLMKALYDQIVAKKS
jgi:pyroglutamyl-peptidase